MWLLDVNMPMGVAGLLGEFGIEAYHAGSRGWGALTNGVLVETASAQGFVCVLTRDRLLGESAARALKTFQGVQRGPCHHPPGSGPEFLRLFRSAWERNPRRPIPGQLLNWP